MNVASLAAILGELPETVGHDKLYFLTRGCFIDARGPLIISGSSVWGFGIKVLTQSHDLLHGELGATINRDVIVKDNAWIGSFSLLYNCIIGEGAIVASGAVVKSCRVADRVMVAGNPARVIARQVNGEWLYSEPKWRLLV